MSGEFGDLEVRPSVHPLTEASIERQGWDFNAGGRNGFTCGCEVRGTKWWLCGYHEGFEDGVEALAEHGPKWTATVTLGEELTARLECPRCEEPWPCPAITPEPRPMPGLHPTIPFPEVDR
jgi:hypothetical protein